MPAAIRELRDPYGWGLALLALLANLLLGAGPLRASIVAALVLAVKVAAGTVWPKPKAPTPVAQPPSPPRRPGHPSPGSKLSPREWEVAALITEGLTNRQIGYRLVPKVGERGVESTVRDIMDKLTVHSRAEIAAWYTAQTRLQKP